MNIQFDSELPNKPAAFFAEKISSSLSRYESRIYRIMVQLTAEAAGENMEKPKICTLEAKPLGSDPVVVSCQGATKELAVNGTIVKLKSALDTALPA